MLFQNNLNSRCWDKMSCYHFIRYKPPRRRSTGQPGSSAATTTRGWNQSKASSVVNSGLQFFLSHSSPLQPDQPHSHMCIKMIIQGGRRFAEESALAGAQEDDTNMGWQMSEWHPPILWQFRLAIPKFQRRPSQVFHIKLPLKLSALCLGQQIFSPFRTQRHLFSVIWIFGGGRMAKNKKTIKSWGRLP